MKSWHLIRNSLEANHGGAGAAPQDSWARQPRLYQKATAPALLIPWTVRACLPVLGPDCRHVSSCHCRIFASPPLAISQRRVRVVSSSCAADTNKSPPLQSHSGRSSISSNGSASLSELFPACFSICFPSWLSRVQRATSLSAQLHHLARLYCDHGTPPAPGGARPLSSPH